MDTSSDKNNVPKPCFDNARGLRSADGPLTKHSILNILLVELSQGEEEKTLNFEGINGTIAEEVIGELDRIEHVPKRITYNSLFKTLRVVIMPHKVHEAHLPWLQDTRT